MPMKLGNLLAAVKSELPPVIDRLYMKSDVKHARPLALLIGR